MPIVSNGCQGSTSDPRLGELTPVARPATYGGHATPIGSAPPDSHPQQLAPPATGTPSNWPPQQTARFDADKKGSPPMHVEQRNIRSIRVPNNALPVYLVVVLAVGTIEVRGSEARSPQDLLRGVAAIHPTVREVAAPAEGKTVTVNPPPLVWPVSSGSQVRYAVRLSQDARFQGSRTIRADGLRWAMFNAHTRLAPGTWHWQYAAIRKSGEAPQWSDVFRFRVDDSARIFLTPPAEAMLAACPKDHPRILATKAELATLRARLKGSPELAATLRSADRYVGRELPEPSAGRPDKHGKNPFEEKNYAKWASKSLGGNLLGTVKSLVRAYHQSGQEQYGSEAVRWALFVAGLDPDGVTSRSVSDFADGSCIEALALAYDTCYDLFTEEERVRMRRAMLTRGRRFFGRCINRLEAQMFSAHIWQHILMQATELAFAMLGEEPESEVWAAYVYELWIARFPLLGGHDGGWANGLNYFGTNFHTLTEMPSLFGRLTGVDFLDHPWYRAVPLYQIYCWPPGSASDGFGDGAERESPPSASRGTFVKMLGEKFQDPYALWYAKQILGDRYTTGNSASETPSPEAPLPEAPLPEAPLPEAPLPEAQLPEPKSPADLPQARAFRDIGIVSMHTQLADPANDLMIGFRSSPYGSFNHMHSDQNSFTLLVGGERLFGGSGYYIGYGDDHFKNWYTHTRGHNSVLIDQKGQVRGSNGYGWVARFLHGRQISYCLGDARAAYAGTGLTCFRRHVVLLRPSTVVIYDELEADHAAEFTWLLHSKNRMTSEGRTLTAGIKTARARVDLFGSLPLTVSVDDRFDPPAANWRGKTSGGQAIEYPNQWHATATPARKSTKMRFLATIQVSTSDEARAWSVPVEEAGGKIHVGDWQIEGQLDTSKDASLVIQRSDQRAILTADKAVVTTSAHRYELPPATSSLFESADNIVLQCRDELPAAAR